MCTKLGKPPEYKPLTRMMRLEREEMEYAWRALDLWLTVTPPLPEDREAYYYSSIVELFEEGLKDFSASELRFHLLVLIFRALLKIRPYYAGRNGFLKMCRRVEELDSLDPTDVYLHSWLGFCREVGVLFKYDERPGREWRENFKKGILAVEDYPGDKPRSLFRDSLKRMDGLDREIRETRMRQQLKAEERPLPDSENVFNPGRVSQ